MNRHFWRACGREDGFTFVELLVTIIIAGLAFAAMVPVFVGAQQVSSGEVMRNAALQLAQDKLEKIRGLNYDEITEDGLADNTIENGDFGTTTTWSTGGGGSRDFHVAYRVDFIDGNGQPGAADGTEKYKQITVTASWSAPPGPVKAVVLSTMISKQYAGPQIERFHIGPESILSFVDNMLQIQSGPVDLDAYIRAEDIGSMNQDAALTDPDECGYVQFTVTPVNGTAVASAQVLSPVSSSEPAHYHFQWDNSSAPDGMYIFQVYAVAGFGSRTQGVPWSYTFEYANHSPAAPTSVEATAGDAKVSLTWVAPSIGDLDHYEVYRSTDNATFSHVGDADTVTAYEDTGLTNSTTYYYKVRTVDTEGYSGPFSDVASATPIVPDDTTAPSAPAPMTATADTADDTVHLSWTASVDAGTPATGLKGYTIERLPLGGTVWEPVQVGFGGTAYDDKDVGWSTTWTYRVIAVDWALNNSTPAVAGPVTTIAPIPRNISVTNSSSQNAYVWVLNTGTHQWYSDSGSASSTQPSGVQVKKNSTTVWANVPSGLYEVYYMPSHVFDLNEALKLVTVDVNSGNGAAAYP